MSNQQVNQLAEAFAKIIKDNKNIKQTSYEDLEDKPKISVQKDLVVAVEEVIDLHLGGLDLLFTKNTVATSPKAWAKLVYGTIDEHYTLKGLGEDDVLMAVLSVKDDNREELLGRMANNLVYATNVERPDDLEGLKEILIEGGAYLEEEDDEVLEEILSKAAGGGGDLKIGLDPNDSEDKEKIMEAYGATGGQALWGQLNTVCSKGDKHGGTYKYGDKTYQMFHDSHGATGANENLSVTAWKIDVGGNLQVVGVGHHEGSASYRAVFPLSDDPAARTVGPSPDITHLKKPDEEE
jgi:hypothetical protein